MVDFTRQINESGSDQIINNSRVRANTASTNAQGVLWMQGTGVVSSQTSAGGLSLTAAQFGGGIAVLNFSAAAQTLTLDTAANMLAYMNANSSGISVGDITQCLIVNGNNTNAFTVAAGAGGAFDPNQAVAAQIVPANTTKLATIRITNVTTPAYVLYL